MLSTAQSSRLNARPWAAPLRLTPCTSACALQFTNKQLHSFNLQPVAIQPAVRASVRVFAAASPPWTKRDCRLVMADGTVFHGRSFGAPGTKVAEVVFNTSLSGYQEIMTDPSYKDQMVCFTYPHIGNVGINDGTYDRHCIKH